MKFKVEIIRHHKSGNPFRPLNIMGTSEATIRRWVMDCKDEAEIRRFFAEAKAQDLENVRGFELYKITRLPNTPAQTRPASSGAGGSEVF
jgi:hypothetical protein